MVSFVDLLLMLLKNTVHGKIKEDPLLLGSQEETGPPEVLEEDPGQDHADQLKTGAQGGK